MAINLLVLIRFWLAAISCLKLHKLNKHVASEQQKEKKKVTPSLKFSSNESTEVAVNLLWKLLSNKGPCTQGEGELRSRAAAV